jgi:sugar/nucleoside kinase (ribokinase family)
MGHQVAVLPKGNSNETKPYETFMKAPNVTVYPVECESSTSIENRFFKVDREQRESKVISKISSYRLDDIPDVKAKIYHIAGLMNGDISDEILEYAAKNAMAAVDVQSILRYEQDGRMVYHDWKQKKKYLPMIRFLKADAAEAEVLTGMTDRKDAAKQLYEWGAKEIMITHNTEVMIYDGKNIYTQPLKPRNLSGRSGRGDTTFACYINERLNNDIPESLLYAAAMISLKMETPGPFLKSKKDVLSYINTFYKNTGIDL